MPSIWQIVRPLTDMVRFRIHLELHGLDVGVSRPYRLRDAVPSVHDGPIGRQNDRERQVRFIHELHVLQQLAPGSQAYDRRTPTGVTEAIATLRVALARDSAYAAAWNALAKAYTRAYGRAFSIPGTPTERLLPLAIAAVDRSLSLDSASADAWATHALVSHQVDPVDLAPALR